MNINDLIALYEEKRAQYGKEAYKHISQLFKEIKEAHKKAALKRGISDSEQSFRAFKGKNLEKLIEYIISSEVRALGLDIINGNKLEKSTKLPLALEKISAIYAWIMGSLGCICPMWIW